jgi:hypothetical protein
MVYDVRVLLAQKSEEKLARNFYVRGVNVRVLIVVSLDLLVVYS